MAGLLAGYRVLDLCDEKGMMCGRLLADLGAEVIAVEPPGGNPCRRLGPFYPDGAAPDKSLHWFAYALNKKGITLNLASEDGRALMRALAGHCDVVVDSFAPDYLEGLGLGYEHLRALDPRLIAVSITPFGENGPYRDYKGSDLVHWALGGMQYLSGDPDRPPVRISFPQSYLHAGAHAAVGTIAALYHRELTGQGQRVSVAVHDCIPPVTLDALPYWDMLGFEVKRAGTARRRLGPKGPIETRMVFPSKDGHVVNYVLGGLIGEPANRELSVWMESEGMDLSALRSAGWPGIDFAQITPEEMRLISDYLAEFTTRHTKADLYERVFASGPNVMLVPVSTPRDLFENRQLATRGFWVAVEHDDLGATLTYPGPWGVIEDGPPLREWQRAPLIGEHNEAVYGSLLGLGQDELAKLRQAEVI